MDEYKCECCRARKHASQLRWYRDELICLYCWMKFDQEAKWYGLDKISGAVEKQFKSDYEISSDIIEGPGDRGVVLND